MSEHVTDPNDPRLTKGTDTGPVEQARAYLVVSAEERAMGFVRPVRDRYVHLAMKDGSRLPTVITSENKKDMEGCGAETRMSQAIAETYAHNPKFYSHTYCIGCKRHLPVDEFTWDDGSVVGS